jgi:hypothetical protein
LLSGSQELLKPHHHDKVEIPFSIQIDPFIISKMDLGFNLEVGWGGSKLLHCRREVNDRTLD